MVIASLMGSAGSLPSCSLPPCPCRRRRFWAASASSLSPLRFMRETRLLTLTGAGGSGKTRLALRLAETCRRDYSGGAAFVGFADINDAELIIPTISQALGLGEVPGKPDLDRLQERLAQRELLLVLDNLEQLTPGTGVLGDLLSRCPRLSMLVTSREPLHLAGEQQYEVPLLEPRGRDRAVRRLAPRRRTRRQLRPRHRRRRSASGLIASRSRSSSPPREPSCSHRLRCSIG